MESSRYSSHSFVKGSTLNGRAVKHPDRIKSIQITGFVDTEKSCELVYLLERSRLHCANVNLAQVAACILGSSREVFYDGILSLLNVLDPNLATLTYCDTDRWVRSSSHVI